MDNDSYNDPESTMPVICIHTTSILLAKLVKFFTLYSPSSCRDFVPREEKLIVRKQGFPLLNVVACNLVLANTAGKNIRFLLQATQ